VAAGDVMEVVFVEIGVHPGAGPEQLLVVLRSRQRRQIVDLEDVDRQFSLDDVEIAEDRLRGVVRKSGDVAGVDHDAGLLPFQQHLAVFGDLVLLFLRRHQIGRVDVFKPDILRIPSFSNDPINASKRGQFDQHGTEAFD
jgi:hypothetical protein